MTDWLAKLLTRTINQKSAGTYHIIIFASFIDEYVLDALLKLIFSECSSKLHLAKNVPQFFNAHLYVWKYIKIQNIDR